MELRITRTNNNNKNTICSVKSVIFLGERKHKEKVANSAPHNCDT